MDEGVQSLRCGECGGWVPSVRWMRKFSAVGAVRTGGQSVRRVRGLGAVGASDGGSSMQSVQWIWGMSRRGSDGLCAGCGLCARESLSRRSPSGLSQDLLGLRIEREELVLRPCLGCFLSYKERTEVDRSLYLVKNNSCSQPDLIWCGASRSLDPHFLSSDALDSFSDPTSSLSITCVILL